MNMLKERISILSQSKSKLVGYVIVCVMITICFTIVPLCLWMTSGIETRGITSIRGDSMYPTVDNNDILYVQPTKYERGEIVVAMCPNTESYSSFAGSALLKRIVGLPGEKVEITAEGVLINGVLLDEEYTNNQELTLQNSNDYEEIILSDNEYFLLGDNRATSFDSRHVGAVHSMNFLYGLTTRPNDYTYTILRNVVAISALNIICIIACMWLSLVLYTHKQYGCKPKPTKKCKTYAQKAVEHYESNQAKIGSRDPQPKSKKNQKRIEQLAKSQNARAATATKKKSSHKKKK